jgi:hypothetical protein
MIELVLSYYYYSWKGLSHTKKETFLSLEPWNRLLRDSSTRPVHPLASLDAYLFCLH